MWGREERDAWFVYTDYVYRLCLREAQQLWTSLAEALKQHVVKIYFKLI